MGAGVRGWLEAGFGADFARVRVHVDAAAASAAARVAAEAFTTGQDIYFARGRYQPEIEAGRRLLAHEMMHTRQQREGEIPSTHQFSVNSPADAYDAEADRAADVLIAARGTSSVYPDVPSISKTAGAAVLQRQLRGGPAMPVFTVDGAPDVSVTPSGQEHNTPNQAILDLGDFTIGASLRVQAPQPDSLNDWEVGILQMVSGPIDRNCYERPAPRQPQGQAGRLFQRFL